MPPYPTPEITPCTLSIESDSCVQSVSSDTSDEPPLKKPKLLVKAGDRCFPGSQYNGWKPPAPEVTETDAIRHLGAVHNAQDHSEDVFNIWKLDQFAIYRKGSDIRHANELCSLHFLKVENGYNDLLVDGVLDVSGEQRFIRGASFECLTLEGYGDETEHISLCIQTALGRKANVWYELLRPAQEYHRYHKPFLWVARFVKYVVDFLGDSESPVTLAKFRLAFHPYLCQKYGSSTVLHDWIDQYGSNDFRQAFCAHIGFLVKECHSVHDTLLAHPIFAEADPKQLRAIPMESTKYDKTLVTPFVYNVFSKMPFHNELYVLHSVDSETTQRQKARKTQLRLTPTDCKFTEVPHIEPNRKEIRRGNVISVMPDTDGQWKSSTGVQWYAYVQKVRTLKNGRKKLDVIWLYQPSDTTLSQGNYPWKNELFMSDNCSCGRDALDMESVISTVPVKWFVTNPEEAPNSFFVRQKFRTEETLGAYDFLQLEQSDFQCNCSNTQSEMDQVLKDFKIGDTVLVRQMVNQEKEETLEPAYILGFSSAFVTLRRFVRCQRDLDDGEAPPNQITIADAYAVTPEAVIRKCKVASFASINDVTFPFDQLGAGDFWFVISSLTPAWSAPDNMVADTKLRGLGIFCGGGSLDRGIEEGGAVTFKYGVDWAQHALHTYRANLDDPEEINLFPGSVNDYLAKALKGSKDKRIATVGDIDLLAAGSPCPGFSVLQRNKNSLQSLRNCSLVASVCSYVDFYAPTYLILENVIGMASNPGNAKDLNVFSQVLCCLVSMGYSVQQHLMDPGHYGSCQSRMRIFIIATAPGYHPPATPPQTHTCAELERSRSIGKASNGLPFGRRRKEVCPFKSLTARGAFDDLPDISDGHVQTCISFPDHRMCRHESAQKRELIQMVPRWPYGQNFVQAVQAGKMSKNQIEAYRWENRFRSSGTGVSWSRIYPDQLVGCLTTMIKPHDAFGGRTIHYDQQRLMSVMEARRTQSIPDHEVVIGSPTEQWRIIGNGVDRKVAFAIGLQIADAWKRSLLGQNSSPSATNIPMHHAALRSPSSCSQDLSGLTVSRDVSDRGLASHAASTIVTEDDPKYVVLREESMQTEVLSE